MSDQGTPGNDYRTKEYPQSLASSVHGKLELSVDVVRSGASVMRELMEIQRLRGKLYQLRVHGVYPSSGSDQNWILIPARIWHKVMGKTGDDAE